MLNKIIAYDIHELQKKEIILASKKLFKSKVIDENQWLNIQEIYRSRIYTPNILMRLFFFIISLIALSATLGLGGLWVIIDYGILVTLLGIGLLFLTEKLFIKEKYHFRSGITEAGIYTGVSLMAFGILRIVPDDSLIFMIIGFILTGLMTLRYLDLVALFFCICFLGGIVFTGVLKVGGILEAFLPFILMCLFAGLLYVGNKLNSKWPHVLYDNHFVLLKSLALVLFYLSGNYFVVRELSIELMDLQVTEQNDIPFAWIFYAFTVLIPIVYLFRGIKTKSLLYLRVSLFIMGLTFMTFQYYYFSEFLMGSITIAGAVLIIISLIIFNYLKGNRYAFTSDKLLLENWDSKDAFAFVASQTLGANDLNVSTDHLQQEGFKDGLGGGGFGGGGASIKY